MHFMTTPFSPITLQQIAEPLGAPFPSAEIKFLPKFPQQREGKWFCLAYPYADKRAYEDRLNALAYGHWQTPPPIALATANKLIIFVTVVLCGIPHTDVGEAFLSRVSRKGEAREEENTATAAYSQAFRRACAQFGLGRYLYTLPKLWLPYNPQERVIALSADEKQQTVERLYRKAGLLAAAPPAKTSKPAVSANASQHHGPSSAQKPDERAAENGHISADELAWVRQQLGDDAEQIAEVCQRYQVGTLAELATEQASDLIWKHLVKQGTAIALPRRENHTGEQGEVEAVSPAPPAASTPSSDEAKLRETEDRITPYQQGWVERQLAHDPARIANVCQFYHVERLSDLSGQQTRTLVDRLLAQQAKERRAKAGGKVVAR
jgi:hypothetical protein